MQPNPKHPRLGVPDDKLGLYAMPVQDTDAATGETRQAVVVLIIPPVALRDAPREVVEHFVAARRTGILASIVDEIWRAYTSDPVDETAARNLADTFTRHADAQRGKKG